MSNNTIATAYVQILPSTKGLKNNISTEFSGAAESASKSLSSKLGGTLSGVAQTAKSIGKAIAGIGAISGAAFTGMATAANSVADYGDNIDKMSQKMGLSAESYQEWEAVMQHSGTSMETMKASMKTLATAAETNSAAFEALGVSTEGLSQEELFEKTITALQGVEDTTQRTYLAGKLLGRGATELGALLNTSAEDTEAMKNRVRELGGVMSEDSVKAAAKFKDSLQDMQTSITGAGRKITAELLPGFTGVMDGIAATIAGDSNAEELLDKGVEKLSGSLGNITSKISKIASKLLPSLLKIVNSLITPILNEITKALPNIITGVLNFFTENIQPLTQGAVTLFTGIVQAIPQVVTVLVQNLPQIINSITKSLTESLPQIIDAGVTMLGGIVDAIPQVVATLLEKLPDIFNAVVSVFTEKNPVLTALAAPIAAAFVSIKTAMAMGDAISKLKTALTAGQTSLTAFSTFLSGAGGPIVALSALAVTLALVISKYNELKDAMAEVDKAGDQHSNSMQQNIQEYNKFRDRVKRGEVEDWEYREGQGIFNKKTGNKLVVPAFADGGIVKSPTLALVGEAGPEAVVPLGKGAGSMKDIFGSVFGTLMSETPASSGAVAHAKNYDRPLQIELVLGRESLGRIAVDSINELQRKSGKVLLEV